MYAADVGGVGAGFVHTPSARWETAAKDAAKTGTNVLRALDMALDDATFAEEVTPDVD